MGREPRFTQSLKIQKLLSKEVLWIVEPLEKWHNIQISKHR